MNIRDGIISTAQSLGVSPLDLATVISYETAGTFDPTKRGPTTQWGQHRGLIQFGEPQARQHGVDWNNPVASQLGPNGAVASYFRSSGLKPGMGLLDMYSTVNAGAPGLYNRSDANNGGAPGTVRDKVEKQMGPHRQKALALLGGEFAPQTGGQQVTQQSGGLLPMSFSTQDIGPQEPQPWLQREQTKNLFDALAVGFEGMTLNPNEALIHASQARMADRRKTKANKAQRNKTADWLANNGMGSLAEGVRNGSITAQQALMLARQQSGGGGDYRTITGDEAAGMGLDPSKAYNLGPDGKVTAIGGGGVNVNVGGNEGPQIGTIPQGYQLVQDPETGAYRMEAIPGGPEDTSVADGNRSEMNAAGAVNVLEVVEDLRAEIEKNPKWTTGVLGSVLRSVPATGAYNAEATAQTIKANLAFDALSAMRAASPTGGALGSVSERELALLESQIANLDLNQSSKQVLQSLEGIEKQYTRILNKAYETGDPARLDAVLGGRPSFLTGPTHEVSPEAGPTHRFNPETGQIEVIQ